MSGNNVVYFTTTDATGFYATALWVSDGTAAGTKLVQSYPAGTTITPLESFLGGFLFAASTPGKTFFYATEGTKLSTRQIGSGSFGPLPANALTTDLAALSATEEVVGFTRSTGQVIVEALNLATAKSTTLLELSPQSTLEPETVTGFTAVSGVAFFVDGNTAGVSRLYRTDGTAANTVNMVSAQTISSLVVETNAGTGTRLFFAEGTTATPSTGHGELLAMSATATTPTLIADFGAGTAVSSITEAANTLFVVVQNANDTFSLWSSDGSNAAPTLVGNLGATAPTQVLADDDGSGRVFIQVGDQVLIATATATTVLGTFTAIGSMLVSGGTLYFGANFDTLDLQLWSSDGTESGTTQIATIDPTGNADPTNFSELNGTLFFSADDGVHGTELWTWNGSTASMVSDLAPGALGSNPALITPGLSNPGTPLGLVTFVASNTLDSGDFGVSDGTLGGTAVAFQAPPGVVSISNGGLTLSHGSPDTTITLSSPTGGGVLSYTTQGAFFGVSQIDPVTFSESEVLQFTGYNATAVVLLGTFGPVHSGGVVTITDRIASGSTEYFLVEDGDGNDKNIVTELWSSDGTVANTVQVANLGSVYDPGDNVFPGSSDATVGAAGWGALLADDSTNAVSLFTSTGAAGNFSEVTPASIGLSGTIDNFNYFSLALAGSKYFFSVGNGGTIEAVATGGSPGNTAILASETASSSSQVFGDFTTAGTDVYFDDGVGGALYVSDGTAGGTHKLLSTGAYIAPYAPVPEFNEITGVASTASVAQAGTTFFYFTALQGGQTGLYYSDGTSVHTVMASGLAQNAYITESGGNIWFVADSGLGFTTLFETAPGSATATQVVSSIYLKTPYAPPENVTNIQQAVTLGTGPDTFFLTPGTDDVAGGAGDTAIYASPGDLSVGDVIDGGAGINDLYLTGSGTFDLKAPATLDNITQVLVSGGNKLILLRAGTALTVKDGAGDTVTGAANSDSIIGSGSDTVTLGSSMESVFGSQLVFAGEASDGASISTQTLDVTGGGVVTLGTNVAFASVVNLLAPTVLTANFALSNVDIAGSSGQDTITLGAPPGFGELSAIVTGNGGADEFNITGGAADSADFRDTAAHLNGVTIEGFNFAPNTQTFNTGAGDFIDVTDFAFSSAETSVFNDGTLTITNAAGTAHTSIDIPGAPAGGGFVLSSDGGLGTGASFVPQIFTLTTGVDTVLGSATNVIGAAEATLSKGDQINGGVADIFTTPFHSTLQLVGPGTFDLAFPTELTGLSAIVGDTTGSEIGGSTAINQTIVLRNGLSTAVTLGAGHDLVFGAVNSANITSEPENFGTAGYDIFLGDARESVQLSGQGEDVIHVTAATGLANVSDNLEGSFTLTGTEEVDGGGLVPIGGNGNIKTLELAAATHMIELGTVPDLIVGGAGADTIDITNAGATGFGGSVTVQPGGGGDTIVAPINDALLVQGTMAQLNNATIDGVNFLPQHATEFGFLTGTTIDISNLAYAAGVITTSFTGDTLRVLSNGSAVDTFTLPLPGAGTFIPGKDNVGTGTQISFTSIGTLVPINTTLAAGPTVFTGSPGNDVLTIPAGALAAGQTLDGEGGENEITLSGTGSFDLGLAAMLQNFSVLQPGTSGETITLRAGLPMQIAGGNGGDTIIGANAPDVIALEEGSEGDTVVLNNAGDTLLDGGPGGTTISVSATSIGATIDGAIFGRDTLEVTGGGGMVMGPNIRDIASVNLTESGAIFFANGIPGLPLKLTGSASAPGGGRDTIVAGGGGDTITEGSTGGNIFGAGAGDDSFIIDSFLNSTTDLGEFPQGDTIYNFGVSGSDEILVPAVQATVTFDAGMLHIGGPAPDRGVDIQLVGNYSGTFAATLDNATGDTVVTFNGTATSAGPAPCFATGTRILTPRGEIAVEALRVGDLVITRAGACLPVTWLGHRHVSCWQHARPEQVWPIRVHAGAFAPGMPLRDLVLSPDHAVQVDHVLVPIRYLLNGATVVQEPVPEVVYWHVELPQHAVLLADGMPAESFLDTGNRAAFDNGALQCEPLPAA